jgi:hypothetical protein
LIEEAARERMAAGAFECSTMFGEGTAGVQIAAALAEVEPKIDKRLSYLD